MFLSQICFVGLVKNLFKQIKTIPMENVFLVVFKKTKLSGLIPLEASFWQIMKPFLIRRVIGNTV